MLQMKRVARYTRLLPYQVQSATGRVAQAPSSANLCAPFPSLQGKDSQER